MTERALARASSCDRKLTRDGSEHPKFHSAVGILGGCWNNAIPNELASCFRCFDGLPDNTCLSMRVAAEEKACLPFCCGPATFSARPTRKYQRARARRGLSQKHAFMPRRKKPEKLTTEKLTTRRGPVVNFSGRYFLWGR